MSPTPTTWSTATGDEATIAALAAARDNAAGTLHLDDMAHDYNLTSEALSCAIEACMADPDTADLLAAGRRDPAAATRRTRDRGARQLAPRRTRLTPVSGRRLAASVGSTG